MKWNPRVQAKDQGDQIGQNFAIWAIFYGEIFSRKKLPNDQSFFYMSQKYSKNYISFFMSKNYKRMSSAIGY
jgi:hypothetical protein